MTDTEQKEICRIAHINDISDLSDGYHTFRQLYYQRMILFAALVKQNRNKAWKSLRHEDGELCFGGGWFIVGIDTPEGSYTYHYEDNYFSLFDCVELERGKHWDGHTEKDVTRLLSLEQEPCEDYVTRQSVLKLLKGCLLGGETEYQYIKLHIDSIPSRTLQSKIGHCKDCKWWKDSDGVYRRDCYTESKCPMNRREVFEGNGYCYLFEPKMEVESEERV